MRFKVLRNIYTDKVPETMEFRPQAVPGGLWVPGSDTVKVWLQSSLDDEVGMWGVFPMVRCSKCDEPNHLPICSECTARRDSEGQFSRSCSHCSEDFRTKKHWQTTCSMPCRVARTKKLQKEWHRKHP